MTKLLENTFRAVNIALANEFAEPAGHLGLDVTEVIDAAAHEAVRVHAVLARGRGWVGTASPATRTTCSGSCAGSASPCRSIDAAMTAIATRPRTGRGPGVREMLAERGAPAVVPVFWSSV